MLGRSLVPSRQQGALRNVSAAPVPAAPISAPKAIVEGIRVLMALFHAGTGSLEDETRRIQLRGFAEAVAPFDEAIGVRALKYQVRQPEKPVSAFGAGCSRACPKNSRPVGDGGL